jgi:hypothetical protein
MTSHDFQSTEMYLTIARYSSQQMDRVIGSSTRLGRLDQFILDEDRRWLERKTDGQGWRRLSTAFDEVFNRYLNYLSHGLLPSTPIFPGDNSKGAIGLQGLGNILNSTRETLGQLAFESSPHHSSDHQEKHKRYEIVKLQKRRSRYRYPTRLKNRSTSP